VIGRANAGKTTILEKVCAVARGTTPVIYDKDGKSSPDSSFGVLLSWQLLSGERVQSSGTHLIPSIEVS
jgi:hypothetical protein